MSSIDGSMECLIRTGTTASPSSSLRLCSSTSLQYSSLSLRKTLMSGACRLCRWGRQLQSSRQYSCYHKGRVINSYCNQIRSRRLRDNKQVNFYWRLRGKALHVCRNVLACGMHYFLPQLFCQSSLTCSRLAEDSTDARRGRTTT